MIPSVLSIAFMANARDVETRIHKFLGSSQSMKEMEGSSYGGLTKQANAEDDFWAIQREKRRKAEEAQKYIHTAKTNFKNEDHILVKEWLEVLIERNGFAPPSICELQDSDPDLCPTGLAASCKEVKKDGKLICERKFPDAKKFVEFYKTQLYDDIDPIDPCQTLKNPYLDGKVEGKKVTDGQLVIATSAFCKENMCSLGSVNGETGVCQRATKKIRDAAGKLGSYKLEQNMSASKDYDNFVNAHLASRSRTITSRKE